MKASCNPRAASSVLALSAAAQSAAANREFERADQLLAEAIDLLRDARETLGDVGEETRRAARHDLTTRRAGERPLDAGPRRLRA